MPSPLSIVIEGWQHIPHSYAMCTQYIELDLLRRPEVSLYHTHIPYVTDAWKPDLQLFSPDETAKLQSIPSRPPDLRPDVVIRMDWPFRFQPDPSGCPTFVWGTTENYCVPAYALASGKSPSEELPKINSEIIALTQWAATGFLKSGAPRERVHIVPAGFEPMTFYPATPIQRQQLRESLGWNDACVLLNVSAMTPNKGIPTLLTAAAYMIDRGYNLLLVMKGTDSLYTSDDLLKKLLVGLPAGFAERLHNRIRYCGANLTHSQLREWMQAADFYVAPYSAEGFNMPVLEAAACGLPVICTAGGSTEDFIDASWCRTIQSKLIQDPDEWYLEPSIESLVNVLSNSISDTNWVQNARLAGPAWAQERFTWTHVVDQLLDLVRKFV
jgi:glycosyltransferase involved in cell wall biosynthesis